MFLTVHTAVGALIGQQINSPILALVFGFFSHWLLDFIPHGDENLFPEKLSEKTRKRVLFIIASLDLIGVLIVFIFLDNFLTKTNSFIFGFFGATIPDLLWGASEILPFKTPWKIFDQWHEYFHKLSGIRVSIKTGIILQLIVFSLAIFLMFK